MMGVRFWLKGKLLINDWRSAGLHNNNTEIHLEPGYHPLKLEFFEDSGEAQVYLFWKRKGDKEFKILGGKNLIVSEAFIPDN